MARPCKKGLLIFDLNGTLIHEHDKHNKDEGKIIRCRPGGHAFLKKCLHDGWDLAIWSASLLPWIEYVIAQAFPGIPFVFTWSRSECLSVQELNRKYLTKPLSRVWKKYPFYGRNIYLIDNKRQNFILNPENGILIPTFPTSPIARKDNPPRRRGGHKYRGKSEA
jgi:hypothetical protein